MDQQDLFSSFFDGGDKPSNNGKPSGNGKKPDPEPEKTHQPEEAKQQEPTNRLKDLLQPVDSSEENETLSDSEQAPDPESPAAEPEMAEAEADDTPQNEDEGEDALSETEESGSEASEENDEEAETELSSEAAKPKVKDSSPTAESIVRRKGDPLTDTFSDYFNQYASYVILDRAIPHLKDGLKPVQRRILHTMREKDDGRYTKVANLVGATMALHPHGDTSISAALVQIAQKKLLIDGQGNFGNIITGDGAAASRYIEARLTPLAREIAFNPKITQWLDSYDGRAKEPVTLPMKFPLVLAMGAEGIAVGLSTSILPHEFNELIDASIAHLKGEDFILYPNFPTGGIADVSAYNDGQRGGRVIVRARIERAAKRQLRIKEVPYGVTTEAIKASIQQAAEKGQIKIQSIQDYTAESPDVAVNLSSDMDADTALHALYAFTNCQVTLSTNACVILDGQPQFMGVSDILRKSTDHTRELLRQELEIRLGELEDDWHRCSLEKIYIEKEIYMRMRKESEYEAIIATIDKGFEPYKAMLRREIVREDIVRLTEIPIIRISRYSSKRTDDQLARIDAELEETRHKLAHLTEHTINWFEHLKKKYGADYKRTTELTEIQRVRAAKVIVANETLYVNEADGFAGFGAIMRRDGVDIGKCSPLDDIATISEHGVFKVYRVGEKVFIGKDLVYYGICVKNDEKRVFSLIYADADGIPYAKKFRTESYILEREYPLIPEGGKIIYFKAHDEHDPEETVTVRLHPDCRARKKEIPFDIGSLMIKGRGSKGNRVAPHPVSTRAPIKKAPIKKTDEPTLIGD